MAKYYFEKKDDRKAIYDAMKKWKENCLLNEGSLIWEGEAVWTQDNIRRFKSIFVDSPDSSGETFDIKLENQLENEVESVYKFLIELMYIYYLFPSKRSNTYKTKINKLEKIASWKGIEFDRSWPILEALNGGLGSPGSGYNSNRYHEISFLNSIVKQLKDMPIEERENILNQPWKLKQFVDDIRQRFGKQLQMQHVILHLLHPDYFERMVSWGHKKKVKNTFDYMIIENDYHDMDYQLLQIREKLNEKYGEDIDFYDHPEIRQEWKGDIKSDGPGEEPSIDRDHLNVNFEVELQDLGLVFEEKDLLIEQVSSALKNGKHIILTGPPGTGKSKLASSICEAYNVKPMMATASSNWSTYDTIGGYKPNQNGKLYFDDGLFLKCFKDRKTNEPHNKWFIIDEINRADIDKAFGSLFSVLTGDDVVLPYAADNGELIDITPQKGEKIQDIQENEYVMPDDWRIIATMNTIDKSSLYEMSYAFMRRFAFISIGAPKDINNKLIKEYLSIWGMEDYPNIETLKNIWMLINQYRKIGPAIIEDIARHTEENDDFAQPIMMYVLPQFEGLPLSRIKEFIKQLQEKTDVVINDTYLLNFANDFFGEGAFE
ncbi:AAA family ATPase [Alkalibacillus salilacus]|uniref:MoxR-like ATPase n=1 Tax=Alkalibacillus salilacus TaxID=284582 RepID=A0ABT9VGE3_9BACI|nr:AAA family ATPase [Alkalibacillus salilacus]MDQ0160016.1 MoxR-like ATPase [Alkalibacillus salilacus]